MTQMCKATSDAMVACIFCGNDVRKASRSKEHIIPMWLLRATGDPHSGSIVNVASYLERRVALDVLQQRFNVLADVVIARACPERRYCFLDLNGVHISRSPLSARLWSIVQSSCPRSRPINATPFLTASSIVGNAMELTKRAFARARVYLRNTDSLIPGPISAAGSHLA